METTKAINSPDKKDTADYTIAENGLGQNGWGKGYLGEYSIVSAFLFELIATFLFLVVILGAKGAGTPTAFAGLAIGLALVVIDLVGINITGVSVNPARSIGPALFSGIWSIIQLPLFILAPILGARRGAQKFPDMASSKINLSSVKSETAGRRRSFSFCRRFNSFSCSMPIPPYFLFQRQ